MERLCRKTDGVYQQIITDMKMKIQSTIAFALASLLAITTLPAQEYVSTPVEISKEKVKIDGKICYSHIVLERQTLYSISKAYEVSIEDIYRFNPSVREAGLKKNSIIIIPSKEALAQAAPKQDAAGGQTVNKEDTKAERQVTRQTSAPVVEQIDETKAERIHIAKWTEDLDVIANMYGVSVEDIMAANGLKGRKLSRRQKLIIPFAGEQVQAEETIAATPEEDVAQTAVADSIEAADSTEFMADILNEQLLKTDINATIILPLSGSDGNPNKNNIDFYCGCLLAVYDLGNEGINCKINVYDIMNKTTQVNLETINRSDMVIGPVSAADLTRMCNIAPDAKVIVSPLDPRAETLAKSQPRLVHLPASASAQYRDIVDWIEEDIATGDKVLMISEKGARLNNISGPVKTLLDSSSLGYSQFSYSILEGREVAAPLTELMTKEGANRVIIASESEAFVNDVIRNLNLLKRDNIEIILYSSSKVRAFETIEVENLHNLQTRVSLGYYIDYNDPKVRDFLMKYRALYNTEPSQFAFQGYDVAKFCISMCSRYGDDWKNHLSGTSSQMLQSIITPKQENSQGFVNNSVRRIIYDKGYSVRTVR